MEEVMQMLTKPKDDYYDEYEEYIAHQKGTTWLSILSTLVFAGGPTAPAGVATALASALAGSPNSLIAAYYSGKHACHVSVYASGKKPSLSKITYIYYTKSNLSFRSPR
ncbi:hypothetical protein OJ967_11720 [Peribacillus frigoritolerans]|uniref:hypothetical protein n=1 Tax=Peribacillus frigoritolerans TaxID=450367 RepID=UPI002227CFD2|nr:hypothetical protein [Peribacillus frigoritolerans]UYZ01098.1 hypothetical protein OJ967_11720 [Peribacillus frigoritolerans]